MGGRADALLGKNTRLRLPTTLSAHGGASHAPQSDHSPPSHKLLVAGRRGKQMSLRGPQDSKTNNLSSRRRRWGASQPGILREETRCACAKAGDKAAATFARPWCAACNISCLVVPSGALRRLNRHGRVLGVRDACRTQSFTHTQTAVHAPSLVRLKLASTEFTPQVVYPFMRGADVCSP